MRKLANVIIAQGRGKVPNCLFAALLSLSIAGPANAQKSESEKPPAPGVVSPDRPQRSKHDAAIQSRADAGHAHEGELSAKPYAPLTVSEKWRNFTVQTFSPLSAAGTVLGGALAHVTNADPKYGSDSIAFAQRVGASGAMIASQSFFGSFLLASVLHQDPRYFRQGPAYGGWARVRYAISRAWLTRNDAGGTSINWSNIGGTAMATSLALAYYPAASRNGGAFATQFVGNTLGVGIGDVAIEFMPDLRQKFVRHCGVVRNYLEPWRLLSTK